MAPVLACVSAIEKSGGTSFGLAHRVLVLLPLCACDFGWVAFEECSRLVLRVSRSIVNTWSWKVHVEVFGSDFGVYAEFLEKNFYRLSFPPPLWSLIRSFSCIYYTKDMHLPFQRILKDIHLRCLESLLVINSVGGAKKVFTYNLLLQ
jgi:hypothetical protein